MPDLRIYKRGQGAGARWVAGVGLLGFAVFGCYELNEALAGGAAWEVFDAKIPPSFVASAVLFLVFAGVIVWVVNSARPVDFLIETEAELRKVSWPTRADLGRQTVVVLVTVFLMAGIILLADLIISTLIKLMGLL